MDTRWYVNLDGKQQFLRDIPEAAYRLCERSRSTTPCGFVPCDPSEIVTWTEIEILGDPDANGYQEVLDAYVVHVGDFPQEFL